MKALIVCRSKEQAVTRIRTALAGLAFAALAFAGAANAAQIVLTPSSVIGDSGSYVSGSTDNFNAGSIFDQQTGAVSDVFNSNTYWINPDNGPANAFITVDLGGDYSLTSADLFNTHNSQYGDRGTGDFTIVAGNAVTLGPDGYFISGPQTTLFSGTLNAAPVSDPISSQTFAALSADGFRYLEFLPTSVASYNAPCCGANVYGLNELRLFGSAVPEPGSWALMLFGFGGLGIVLRASRKPAAIAA